MREIKFRAWDKKRNIYIGTSYPENWNDDKDEWYCDVDMMQMIGIENISNDDNFMLEQFTGLRDKNGHEIYEGDIVKFDVVASERGPEKFGQTGIVQDVPRYGWGIGGYSPAWIKNEDVIGNIHENPELLNEAV